MSRLADTFARLRQQGRKALIPFVTAGDPSLAATVPVMEVLAAAGADIIELGVPFSDPMADGPVIQRSSERAIARGAGLTFALDSVRQFRRSDARTPVVLMGYLNPVEIRGAEVFARQAADAGVDGVLLVDLPPEESAALRSALQGHGIDLILLASPTTDAARMQHLCAQAAGYVYYVSFAGVTGADRLDAAAAQAPLQALRAATAVPVVAGFGIKDAAGAAAMARDADGVVVGSALVQRLHEADDPILAARRFIAGLRQALDAEAAVTLR